MEISFLVLPWNCNFHPISCRGRHGGVVALVELYLVAVVTKRVEILNYKTKTKKVKKETTL